MRQLFLYCYFLIFDNYVNIVFVIDNSFHVSFFLLYIFLIRGYMQGIEEVNLLCWWRKSNSCNKGERECPLNHKANPMILYFHVLLPFFVLVLIGGLVLVRWLGHKFLQQLLTNPQPQNAITSHAISTLLIIPDSSYGHVPFVPGMMKSSQRWFLFWNPQATMLRKVIELNI